MAKKKGDGDGEDAPAKASKVKMIGGAALLLVAGVFLGPKLMGSSGAGAEEGDPSATTTTTEPAGHVAVLEPITLNLADGRFVKIGLAIELEHGVEYPHVAEAGGHGAPAAEDKTQGFSKELDATIEVVSAFGFDQLVSPEGKEALKQALLARLKETSHDAIADLYFHAFVMQ